MSDHLHTRGIHVCHESKLIFACRPMVVVCKLCKLVISGLKFGSKDLVHFWSQEYKSLCIDSFLNAIAGTSKSTLPCSCHFLVRFKLAPHTDYRNCRQWIVSFRHTKEFLVLREGSFMAGSPHVLVVYHVHIMVTCNTTKKL